MSDHPTTIKEAVEAAIGATPLKGEALDWQKLRVNLTQAAKQFAAHEKGGNEPSKKDIYRWAAAFNMEARESLGLTDGMLTGIQRALGVKSAPAHGITCSGPEEVDFTNFSNSLKDNSVVCKKTPVKRGV